MTHHDPCPNAGLKSARTEFLARWEFEDMLLLFPPAVLVLVERHVLLWLMVISIGPEVGEDDLR